MLGVLRRIIKQTSEKRIREHRLQNGLTIGKNVSMGDNCFIDDFCWLISIGDHVAFASGVQIIAHDASTQLFLGYDKIGKVVIGDDVFIGQNSIILPNVTIGNRVLIGAGSVVTRDIPSNSVAFGNPARVKCTLDEYLERNRLSMKQRPRYDKSWRRESITENKRKKMRKDLEDGVGFLE